MYRLMLWGFLFGSLAVVSSSNEVPPGSGLACDSTIYCHGVILDTIQRAEIYEDSKTFVDMKMLHDPDVVEQAFKDLHNSTDVEILKNFVDSYFSAPGEELDQWEPQDWTEKPPLYYRLEDAEWRQFVLDINAIWKDLGRQIKIEVSEHPDRHSLIYVPNPFIIPGDRFREYYYWDSYWIINGLLVSNMTDTARGMIENFLYLTERFGYIPNGGRVYYSRRSQPPLLTPMVDALYKVTKDTQFLKLHVTTLEKEYLFWKQSRSVNVTQPTTGETYELSRYDADLRTPRPESYREDLKLADCSNFAEGKDAIYRKLASACESGWDFSSRWLAQDLLCTIKTPYIIPVDLNVYLVWTEQLLAKFFAILGDADKSALYESHANKRWAAIQEMLWNEDEGAWFDLDMQTMEHREGFYPSNIFPLMVMSEGRNLNDDVIDKVYRYAEKFDLLQYDGGIPTSLVESGQQWDHPNAWPPLVHLFIESLSSSGHVDARDLASNLAAKWLESNAEGYKKHGQMFEKYDANRKGEPGGGGEYGVQKGFGWTNGVALLLLNNYVGSEQKDTPVGEQGGVPAYTTAAAGVAVGVVLLVAILILLAWFVYKRNTQKRERESEAMRYNSVKQAELE